MVENRILVERARIVRAIRSFFEAEDFLEVETPVWIPAPAPEPHIDCPRCGAAFLRASPELQMKKLLAGGFARIYQMGPCFREGERGRRHHPEFTMLEWYRRGATYEAIADDLSRLLRRLVPSLGLIARLTVREAYRTIAKWDPWTDWDADRFDFDMATKIEPNLPEGPLFLMDYPVQAASLARVRGDCAERWEFYWRRMELANCFTELCAADEQRARFEAAREERRMLDEAAYPLDEEFLACLPRIGSAAGVALGIDRLVMLLCDVAEIADVRVMP
jgi:lysyl-tRNA synthetase class 2